MNTWTDGILSVPKCRGQNLYLMVDFTDLAYADDATILTSDQLQEECPPINAFPAPLGLSYHGPRQNSKIWMQVTRRRQYS